MLQLFIILTLLNVHLDANISVTLYLLQTYPSGKPLFKGQGPVNLTTLPKNFEYLPP